MESYETYPFLKFAHFTANQAILEAFTGKSRVHVIDFSMKQGQQWPALMQALALRPGGPPTLWLTGIGPPQPDNIDALQPVGLELAQFADNIHIEFEFRGFVANNLTDIDASMLDIRPSENEAVAVSSVFELHPLLARSGAVDKVLSLIKAINPIIVTIVEQDKIMSEVYLGRQVCNVVACEGMDSRHESLTQLRGKMESAGFVSVHLGSNAVKQARMLLALFAGGVDDSYTVEENDGFLMLGWHTRPLIATSAWKLSPDIDPTTQ